MIGYNGEISNDILSIAIGLILLFLIFFIWCYMRRNNDVESSIEIDDGEIKTEEEYWVN